MRCSLIVLATFAVTLGCFVTTIAASDEPPKLVLGRKIESFQLTDFRGAKHSLADWSRKDVLVVAFLGTECPLAKLYGARLGELSREFATRSVSFVGIDANEQDTLAEMAHYARGAKFEFPFLKDPANVVANQFEAVRTPEVFVLDKRRVIRYHGRIDDQFGIGYSRLTPQRRDLAIAIDELLAGKSVSTPLTKSLGCHIGRVNRQTPHGDVTYAKQVAPILQKHCVACHRAGEVAPFSLTSYADAANWSATIREVVQQGRMPPWHAAGKPGTFVNDRRMSDVDRQLLFDWIDHGLPEGNPKDLPEQRTFTNGWQMRQPDLVLRMPKPYNVPATGAVEYQYFQLTETFTEDKWVVASEARPGNRAVVHHLILLYMPPGARYSPSEAALRNSIAGFAPGLTAWQAPAGAARKIPAGSKLYFQVHYTPNGTATTDISQAGLIFTDSKTVQRQLLTGAVVNPRLRLGPHSENVRVEASHTFQRDVKLVSLLPHMHLRGKAFHIDLVEPDGSKRSLLDVPRYDFNWQNAYIFPEPLPVRAGSRLHCVATYDNSSRNPANPDPSKTVGWGDQTWEEMFVAQYEILIDAPRTAGQSANPSASR